MAERSDKVYKLIHGDCLKVLPLIKDSSIDMVLCDLPYGVTKNRWDVSIPLDFLWEQYCRVCKDTAAILLFAQSLFYIDLVNSNRKMFRYDLIWDKVLTGGFLNANKMPLRRHEQIAVFYSKLPVYNPQKVDGGVRSHSRGRADKPITNNTYGRMNYSDNTCLLGTMKHPTSIISFGKVAPSKQVHPTQKPVELLEWLIKTYTNEGAVVLDNCMGSGSTGVACLNTGRHFIGIEKDENYFKVAKGRMESCIN